MTRLKSPSYWQQAITELSKNDTVLDRIISGYEGEVMEGKNDPFHTLMRSVTGQQISVKAADAIWGRLEGACDGAVAVDKILRLQEDDLRQLGYSRQKVSYLHSIANYFAQRQSPEEDWAQMEDEEVIKDLTQIRGIGRWTAEMFLMFYLMRPDILPLDDLGLVNAIAKFYHNNERMDKKAMRQLAERWQPWRTVATWYLWRTYDAEPVSY